MSVTARAPIGSISAVVCNYNGEEYLPGCLDALFALAGDVDEIIVVDNKSTDGSLALLEREYPAVRVVEMDTNAGPAAARNAGMLAAEHRWILALDNDAIVRPDLLAKLEAATEVHPDAVVISPRSVFAHEETRVHYDGGRPHYAGLVALRNFYAPLDEAEGNETAPIDVVISVCLLMDKEIVLGIGGYAEEFFILFEDLDLSYRLRIAGHELLTVPDAIVLHRAGTPGVSFREGTDYPASRVFYHSRNRWLFLLRTFRLRTLLVALPGMCVYELVWLFFAVVQGGLFGWIRGKAAVFGSLGQVLDERRDIQARRVTSDRELLVGGPLTLTPGLKAGGVSGVLASVLDHVLRGWWKLAGWLAG